MRKVYGAGFVLAGILFVSACSSSSSHGTKADSAAKQTLSNSMDQCEMLEKVDARETCMDQAWAAFKKARAAGGKMM